MLDLAGPWGYTPGAFVLCNGMIQGNEKRGNEALQDAFLNNDSLMVNGRITWHGGCIKGEAWKTRCDVSGKRIRGGITRLRIRQERIGGSGIAGFRGVGLGKRSTSISVGSLRARGGNVAWGVHKG